MDRDAQVDYLVGRILEEPGACSSDLVALCEAYKEAQHEISRLRKEFPEYALIVEGTLIPLTYKEMAELIPSWKDD